MIKFLLLVSRQGKVRLAKWYDSYLLGDRQKLVKDVVPMVLARKPRHCNFIEYKDIKIVYKRYASLYFIAGTDVDENELLTLEVIHRYVEILDRYFNSAHFVLDEYILGGEVHEASMKAVLKAVIQTDEQEVEEMEEQKAKIF